MKSNFKTIAFLKRLAAAQPAWALLLLLGMGFAVFVGCNAKTPFDSGYSGPYSAPNTVPNRKLVCDFETGLPSINGNLMEMSNAPSYVLKTAGSVTAVNNFPANVVLAFAGIMAGGANGSSYAFQVVGTLTDQGTSTYPAIDLEAPIEGGNLYDGSFFTGVKFYMKIANDDQTTKRTFSVPVYQTQGSPQGGCVGGNAGGCYDNFAFDISAGTGGQWKLFNIPYTSLAQAYAGVKTVPPTFSGANLQQILWLQWEESRNNTAGTSHIDFWVDDIELFQ